MVALPMRYLGQFNRTFSVQTQGSTVILKGSTAVFWWLKREILSFLTYRQGGKLALLGLVGKMYSKIHSS
jgi:hypothetical protein